MDIQLQELIGKIKKDGIESAGKEAEQLKAQAREAADKIVADAKKEAQRIIDQGKADAERSEKAGIASVEQASRNTLLSFRKQLEGLLDGIIRDETAKAYNADLLKEAIPEVLKAWASGKEGGLDLILPEKLKGELESSFKGKFTDTIKGGVEIKTTRDMEAGFRIGEKDGSAYYDFSASQVADAFSAYLNPKLAEAVKNAASAVAA
jgi:V/A-type H+-transporting ATPase subunit E